MYSSKRPHYLHGVEVHTDDMPNIDVSERLNKTKIIDNTESPFFTIRNGQHYARHRNAR